MTPVGGTANRRPKFMQRPAIGQDPICGVAPRPSDDFSRSYAPRRCRDRALRRNTTLLSLRRCGKAPDRVARGFAAQWTSPVRQPLIVTPHSHRRR